MRIFAAILAAIGWFAVAWQAWLFPDLKMNAGLGATEIWLRFFSFFTILTNILAVIVLSATAFNQGKFFSRPGVQTAIAVYFTVISITYFALLRDLVDMQGAQWFVDKLLHLVMPVSYVAFWAVFTRKRTLQWRSFLPWLLFPAAYTILVLARGLSSKFWPYPFFDVTQLGWFGVAQWCAYILVFSIAVSLFYIWLDRRLP